MTSALQRIEAAIATAFPSFPHPSSPRTETALSGLTVSHRGDRDRAVGKLPVSRDDVGRVPLHGDEHPEPPSSGTATVAFPPPGGGRHVLTERAA